MRYMKLAVGKRIWLVPAEECTGLLVAAVAKLNGTRNYAAVEWDEEELEEFRRVCELKDLWTVNL